MQPVLCDQCRTLAELIGVGPTYRRYACGQCVHTWDVPVDVPSIKSPVDKSKAGPCVPPPVKIAGRRINGSGV